MADQNSQYMAILTAAGEAKQANANALGVPWLITQMGVGDANGTEPQPDRLQTALLNELRRAPLNQLSVDPDNAAIIIAEQVIPENVGGWWIREIGLYDEAGDLVAVANCPPTFKPELAQGSARTQVVRLNLLVSSTQNIQLKIDPAVVLATRAYCDSKISDELAKLDHKQSVRYATKAAVVLSGLGVQAGGDWAQALTAGDRVLVKNQAAAKDNGIYVVASGAWVRAGDADLSAEVTSGLVVAVELGATLADSRWQLVTDGAIVLGTTLLAFQDITKGFAPLSSPVFTGDPVAPTPAQFDSDTSLATTAFVQRALGNMKTTNTLTAAEKTLLAEDVGSFNQLAYNSGPQNVTLPPINSVPGGSKFVFNHPGSPFPKTIFPNGSDVVSPDGQTLSSIGIEKGQTLTFISNPSVSTWRVSGAIAYDSNFGSSLAANGHQKLPSGLIECRGRFIASATPGAPIPVTFPFGFTTLLELVITPKNASNSISAAWFDGETGTGFNGRCNIASAVCHYIAKGV